ncbi:MAG TPA: hypothetical protein VK932_25160, partial [Kofleriaceae bacterium]|nr:hypothetical protein [Kofleriaceae bacterium]
PIRVPGRRVRRIGLAIACALAAAVPVAPAFADGAPELAALAPPPAVTDDARRAVAIGPQGEVYEPDGKGAWVRRQRITTAGTISHAARAGGAVVALGDGVVYRLAPNGWSAIRLAQKGKARIAGGWRAVAAVGRQLVALDRLAGGEPAKLGAAAGEILLVGSGRTIVVATERGLFRIDGARTQPIAAPRRARMLVGDRWAIVDGGAVDLRSGKTTAWPAGAAIEVAAEGHDDRLIAVARVAGKLELFAAGAGKLERAPIGAAEPGGSGPATGAAAAGAPVGVAVDRAGRAVVAFRDGRIAVRDGGAWTTITVGVELPPPRPGAPPAVSP